MHFGDEEKQGRKAALQKLMDMMSAKRAGKLADLKKPAAVAVDVEPMDGDEMGESDDDGDEPSEEDKAKIAELYHKFCK